MLILSGQFANKKVISLRTGQEVAYLVGPIINPSNLKIEGFRVTDSKSKESLILLTQDIRQYDLSGIFIADASGIGPIAPWWPDAKGLSLDTFSQLIPAYSTIDSEPITSFSLQYNGHLTRYSTENPALYRSILPSLEQRKSPWHNKYYYHIPFGTQHEKYGITNPMGHANLDKILNIDLSLLFQPYRGSNRPSDVPDYIIYIWAETYSILRVYGGRAGLLFGY